MYRLESDICIPDPVYGNIYLPEYLYKNIFESQYLWRLRYIKQLGFTYLRYHGAVHTRFESSIGRTHILRQLLNRLGITDREEEEKWLRLSLYKDIGMYPFSYSIKSLFKKYGCNNEEYTFQALTGPVYEEARLQECDCEIFTSSSKQCPEWFKFISEQTGIENITPLTIANRIDYLLRDSHYTGVGFGRIDFRRILAFDCWDTRKLNREEILYFNLILIPPLMMDIIYANKERIIAGRMLYEILDTLVSKNLFEKSWFTNINKYLSLNDNSLFKHIKSTLESCLDDPEIKGIYATYQALINGQIYKPIHVELSNKNVDYLTSLSHEKKYLTLNNLRLAIKNIIGKSNHIILDMPRHPGEGRYRLYGTDYNSREEAIKQRPGGYAILSESLVNNVIKNEEWKPGIYIYSSQEIFKELESKISMIVNEFESELDKH